MKDLKRGQDLEDIGKGLGKPRGVGRCKDISEESLEKECKEFPNVKVCWKNPI